VLLPAPLAGQTIRGAPWIDSKFADLQPPPVHSGGGWFLRSGSGSARRRWLGWFARDAAALVGVVRAGCSGVGERVHCGRAADDRELLQMGMAEVDIVDHGLARVRVRVRVRVEILFAEVNVR